MKVNPSYNDLYKDILISDYQITNTGAVIAKSGKFTGRVPDSKRLVYNDKLYNIWWGFKKNIAIHQKIHNRFLNFANTYYNNLLNYYIIDGYAGWDTKYQLKIRTYCTDPYHALFMKNMLIKSDNKFDKPDFTIFNLGNVNVDDTNIEHYENNLNNCLISLDLVNNNMVIFGTKYAGEMKKGVLTYMMYHTPTIGNLCLHSSANIDKNTCDTTFFFGLSGTGKTTLSSCDGKFLIGDDEHVWTDEGIYNIEGGCYVKCIGLDKDKEPILFDGIKKNSVLENVIMLPNGELDFNDTSITQNTRCAIPLENLSNSKFPCIGNHPKNIIFLTCDATGVMPPISLLTKEQAIYFFLSGYTSKVAGTEQGINEPTATFSTCFGHPFIVHKPELYGKMLGDKIDKYNCRVWMINTGYVGDKYGKTDRINLSYTRKMIEAIYENYFNINNDFEIYKPFNIKIPKFCKDIPTNILNPRKYSNNLNDLEIRINHLFNQFNYNFNKNFDNKFNIYN